ncbi:ABC transporter ATP-binding protein [Methylocella sp. CPCC 101449]|uniref:ABC transporter ATP-binding protein n=1 Tax=Methylocella sp. CPCC 101449 TaxID=2987531 RepID=UPI00095A3D3B|nr:ABC transporter ATP-binding protein [Methylocella sp. CPCC 101449]MBN9081933.1 ABC transporter ATP-binding protein [Hyphomicrobiales bacterium]MDT2021314.1 ABC transporter ATP-binding protein [Methylocella sp. CPCC 101449]OJY05618.1 MAG: ABC transporter ATP-binding protein [Rhizobiales bacterium 62-17]
MTDVLLQVEGLRKRFGGVAATDNLTLDVRAGEVHALIGPNGAGKTTFITQLMGELTPDAGSVRFAGQPLEGLDTAARVRLGIARTFQITQTLDEETAQANVALTIQAHQGHSFRFWKNAATDPSLNEPARRLLADAGLAARRNVQVRDMSHGEHKQLELAMALASEPRLLLLDEPMAGLGVSESRQMIDALKTLKGRIAILLVEHDMDAVFALADRISVLVYGKVIATGTAQEIQADPQVRAAYLGEGDA